MPATTTVDVKTIGLAALEFAGNFTNKLADAVPAEKCCARPVDSGNHVLWILGHLACADDMFRSVLGNQPSVLPENWKEMFGEGTTVKDASAYPSLDEVKSVRAEARGKLIEWFSGMTDEDLAKPLPGDWQGFAKDQATLMSTIACHECLHAGQITVIRKALKLDPVFM